ncbi:esterase-like activity of phytase family protein [Ovoidimarina sediminis]|uniref:esterase-like activity of phytase family protein n=1 Tax=Ovoidimarina sediminis TaxID=3079856 RepID=UPI00290FF038|nr:esterase-like activity of phytase family protein [Rhodophyticola sp. MJ-SS7]MDU8942458.1 esterase-like activity of phytase family protein [Rhodophyticola sp. MJ-SS7]
MRSSSYRALIAAIFLLFFHGVGLAQAEFLGAFTWEREEEYFGGVSGFDFFDDGSHFAAVGDNAITLIGTFERTDGRITAVTSPWIGGLRDVMGNRVQGNMTDAEGLALTPDGHWLVSFEDAHRVVEYADREARGRPYPVFRMMRDLAENRSLEGIAVDRDGAIFVLSEGRLPRTPGFPVFRFADGVWALFATLPEDGAYRPVGADFGPDGRLYVLWRRLALPFRFASRVTRHEVGEDGLTGGERVLQTELGAHDNLEGLAVWADETGLRLTMVSDDNYRGFQRTEFVEYRLSE